MGERAIVLQQAPAAAISFRRSKQHLFTPRPEETTTTAAAAQQECLLLLR
jgi:hypothetical protein